MKKLFVYFWNLRKEHLRKLEESGNYYVLPSNY